MTEILSYSPGQQVTIFLETKDSNGVRQDGYSLPVINNVLFPGYTLAMGYPQSMTRLDVGLFTFQFTLPTGGSAVGSYLVEVSYISPANGYPNTQLYQIIVSAPFGNYGVTVLGGP
jgi:hypothetical protein